MLVAAAVLIGLANAALYVGLDDVIVHREPDPWLLPAVLMGLSIPG